MNKIAKTMKEVLKYKVGDSVKYSLTSGEIYFTGIITRAGITEDKKPYTILTEEKEVRYAHEKYLSLSK